MQTHKETYFGTGGCPDQNSTQMFTRLSHSLTEAKDRLKPQSVIYRIGIEDLTDGPCYLKLIIQKWTTASQAMAATNRNSLNIIPAYMESIECNIAKFNKHVRVLQGSIYQHDEECPNLLINLFTAYHTVQVIDFKDFVKLQLTLYFNGKADFEVEELMEVASNQYKMLVKSGTWKSTTATKDHFVALTAEIAALKQANANKGGLADSHCKEDG